MTALEIFAALTILRCVTATAGMWAAWLVLRVATRDCRTVRDRRPVSLIMEDVARLIWWSAASHVICQGCIALASAWTWLVIVPALTRDAALVSLPAAGALYIASMTMLGLSLMDRQAQRRWNGS